MRSGRRSITSSHHQIGVLAVALFASSHACAIASPVTIDLVTVGNAGNAADTTGYGAVSYEYKISKYEVTMQQYTGFLNSVAQSDPYGLWSELWSTLPSTASIARSGSSGSYTYSVAQGDSSKPVFYVSWFSAARFANWMHNGQGAGGTETGSYTLNGVTSGSAVAKNPDATYYIPTENEWYKAAFYSPVRGGVGSPGYYFYATQSNVVPGNTVGSDPNQANYNNYGADLTQDYRTVVGAFTNSASYYGTFDQNGNVNEYNDLDGNGGPVVGLRGGSFYTGWGGTNPTELNSSSRYWVGTDSAEASFGFRLAATAAVPEPSTWVMGAGGFACLVYHAFRRRYRRAGGGKGPNQSGTSSGAEPYRNRKDRQDKRRAGGRMLTVLR